MPDSKNSTPILSDKVYNVIKWFAQILLPASGAAYFSLGAVLGLPNGEQVVGTIAVIDTFLGAILGVSYAQYKRSDSRFDGSIVVVESEEVKQFTLDLNSDPNELDDKQEVLFKVEKE